MNSPAPPSNRIFQFGQFELSEREGELRKSGVRIKLHEQPPGAGDTAVKSGKDCGKDELQKTLWPADTLVDFEVGLNQGISKIRQALSDDADHPRYIETVAKRGYRFLASAKLSKVWSVCKGFSM
jgi:DNA-binding winged helix-turn-helix (wHTH) protein